MRDTRKKAISIVLAFILAVTLIPMGAALGSDEEAEGYLALENAGQEATVHEEPAEEEPLAIEIIELEPEAEEPAPVAPEPEDGSSARGDKGLVEPLGSIVSVPPTQIGSNHGYDWSYSWDYWRRALADYTPSGEVNFVYGNRGDGSPFRFFAEGSTPITWTISNGKLPPGLSLSSDGRVTGTPTQGGVFEFVVKASNPAGSIMKPYSILIGDTPTITSTTLTNGALGFSYKQTLKYSSAFNAGWGLTLGNLPPGLTISSAGVISGKPTKTGTYSFTVGCENSWKGSENNNGVRTDEIRTVYKSFTITITQPTPPTITTASLPGGIKGNSYKRTLAASGSTPITWTRASGSLPPGLSLSSAGVISGTPANPGSYTFTVKASNPSNNHTKQFTIVIDPRPGAPLITTASLAAGIVGDSYKRTLAASGVTPITWTHVSGNLPPGLSLSRAGVLTGNPTAPGTFTFSIRATNSSDNHTKSFKIIVRQKPKVTTTIASVHDGITGINYKKTFAANGTGTISWSRISGSLPPGLKLSSAGVITGKPTKPGTYTFKVRATNNVGSTTKTFTIKVNNPSISISYQTHVQSVGWQAFKKDGAMSGTSGKALRLEGIKINLKNNTGISGGIRYSTHVQSIGWQKKVSLNTNGKSLKDVKGPMSGTSGRALRLEAITIELTGDLKKHYDIYYRVHAQSVGWMGWARNGQEAGTAGHAYRLEGIQIVLVPKVGGKKPGNTFKGITTPPNTKSFIKK